MLETSVIVTFCYPVGNSSTVGDSQHQLFLLLSLHGVVWGSDELVCYWLVSPSAGRGHEELVLSLCSGAHVNLAGGESHG